MIAELELDLGRTKVLDPLPYAATIACLVHASVIITDSGGLQKGLFFWKNHVSRFDETEWGETLEKGITALCPQINVNS